MISQLAKQLDSRSRSRISISIELGSLKLQSEADKSWQRSLRLYANPDSKAASQGHKVGFPVLPETRS
jgi:hypothetical protein